MYLVSIQYTCRAATITHTDVNGLISYREQFFILATENKEPQLNPGKL